MENENYHNPNDNWYYDYRMSESKDSYRMCVYCIVGIVILVFALMLAGCKSIQYVPVEVVKTEYINKTDTFIQKDSIHIKDSTSVTIINDTVFKEMWHTVYKDKWRNVIKIDSFIKTDSIQVPYPVERKLSKWEQVKMDAGGLALGTLVFVIIAIIVSWLIKLKKRSVLF